MATRDRVIIGLCLLAILISGLVLGLVNDPSAGLIVPFGAIIFVSVTLLAICGIDALRPGIFDACAEPADFQPSEASVAGRPM